MGNCRDCDFFERVQGQSDNGECHRNPPQIVSQSRDDGASWVDSAWPDVDGGAWCGEFKPKDAA